MVVVVWRAVGSFGREQRAVEHGNVWRGARWRGGEPSVLVWGTAVACSTRMVRCEASAEEWGARCCWVSCCAEREQRSKGDRGAGQQRSGEHGGMPGGEHRRWPCRARDGYRVKMRLLHITPCQFATSLFSSLSSFLEFLEMHLIWPLKHSQI